MSIYLPVSWGFALVAPAKATDFQSGIYREELVISGRKYA